MKLSTRQLTALAVFCLVLFCVVIWALYAEYDRPWKLYQQQFRQLNPGRSSHNNSGGIRQIWNQELGAVDRCVTCHEGIDNHLFISAREPFQTHSGNYLKYHPADKFGCVICHEGQGPALTADAAHGEVNNWTKPVLRGAFAQASCRKCHDMEQLLPISAETDGAPALITGWRLFQQYNCTGCHRLSELNKPARRGPALSFIGDKVNRPWLIKWLKNPGGYLPKTKMPRFTLTDEETGYLADYLMSLGHGKQEGEAALSDKNAIKEGAGLVNDLGCTGCHTIHERGSDFGPDFSDIGNKVNPGWLIQFLKNPQAYDPKTIIPDFRTAEDDIEKIAAYLMSLKKVKRDMNESPPSPALSGRERASSIAEDVDKGKKLVKDLGCTGCHEIEKLPSGYNAPDLDAAGDKRVDELAFGNRKNMKKTLKDWMLVKVTDPGRFATDRIVTMMPYYDFNEGQAGALVTYLLSLRKDSVPPEYKMKGGNINKPWTDGRDLIEKYNCRGCHMIEHRGGTIGPDLTMEGKKSRPEWLFSFLKSPYKIRPLPMLKAGMPNFHLSDSEVTTLIAYLSFISEEPYPYMFEPKKEIGPEDVWNGEKLYQEIFACSGCHTVNGHGGQVGPDHTDLASRGKREWITQWLENPQAITPGVRMPRFTFRDWELKALTDYLMTLGTQRFVDIQSAN
jgi:mono/diheme cytochrome c family protein